MAQNQGQSQDQLQDQLQDQTQQQTLSGGDNSATGGNAEATGGTAAAQGGDATGGNVGDVTTSINYKRPYRNPANAYAPPVQPTVSCFKGASGSAVGPGFGISIGAGKIDKGCVRRELIRLAPESHKLYLFCYEPTVLTLFDDHQTCLDHNKEVMTDEPIRRDASRYDDAALTKQIEALVARVSAVETTSKETKVIAKESKEYVVAAYEAPFEAVRDELRHIQRVEK